MLDGTVLEVVDDFQYLGAWVNGTMKDSNIGVLKHGQNFGN